MGAGPKQAHSEAAGRALVGLLVHSAADGFAVGASAVSTSSSLSFLVAVAMVLHKVGCQIRLTRSSLQHAACRRRCHVVTFDSVVQGPPGPAAGPSALAKTAKYADHAPGMRRRRSHLASRHT